MNSKVTPPHGTAASVFEFACKSGVQIHTNEIRDYLYRAPRRRELRCGKLVNNTGARLRWLEELCRGTIHERINRRAGMDSHQISVETQKAIWASIRRHKRGQKTWPGLVQEKIYQKYSNTCDSTPSQLKHTA